LDSRRRLSESRGDFLRCWL